jgi:hypothetical protein
LSSALLPLALGVLGAALAGAASGAVAVAGAGPVRPTAQQAATSCATCHGEEGLAFAGSVHARARIGCVTCHGGAAGAPSLPEAHGEGVAPLTDPTAAVETCGGCHADQERMRGFGLRTDQLALYRTSAHGQRLLADGDAQVATCVSCHGAHDVLSATDPLSPVFPLRQPAMCASCHADAELMARYELDATIPESYAGSVHGVALLAERRLASPACSDCHGSHGATPPRVAEVGRVCGHCHVAVRAEFERGPHAAAVEAGAMQECISCHDEHAIRESSLAMLAGDEPGHCGHCHSGEGAALEVARSMKRQLVAFEERIDATEVRIERAARRALVLGTERGYLAQARDVRAGAGPVLHALAPGDLEAFLDRGEGMVEVALGSLERQEHKLRDRKIATAVFFGVAIVLAGLLMLYRREISGGWRTGGAAAEER